MDRHLRWMEEAFKEAEKAYAEGEVPIGAVVVLNNKIIGRGHNQVENLQDATAHAEMIAITAAANHLSSWRLEGASLYVTLEPCPMCAGAIVHSRIQQLIFGCFDPKGGACGSLYNVVQDSRLNHQVEIETGILADRCAAILKEFFTSLRKAI
ncbi:tRNA adenosine(34) deaminase TadA [candidate division KSB1 bacterium]|nr:MAG: tRNA adenosine(34) deaminase TadA [candidate division KSB1 bacterium]